jgi:uncharacterized protein YqeY
MSLGNTLSEDLKAALKSGDKDKVSILRMIKSSIKNQEIDKKSSLDEKEITAILRSFVKRAKESIEQYANAGRSELAEKEERELSIIQNYLPKQLDEESARKMIKEVVGETGAAGPRDMGKVMKALMVKSGGQIDGKMASSLVKEILEA